MFQLLSYIVRIWEKQLRDGLELCPVVPLVVYHDESGWTAARTMSELLQAPEALAAYQVQLRLPLLDLSYLADEEIGGEAILRSTLRLLKYSRSVQLSAQLLGILRGIAIAFGEQVVPREQLDEWLKAMGSYMMAVNKDIDPVQYKQTLRSVFPTQFEPGSIADQLLTKGREEGRQEGRKSALIETVRILQELLGERMSSEEILITESLDSLSATVTKLQQSLRDRR